MDERLKGEVWMLAAPKPKKFEGQDVVFAVFMLVIGFLYWNWIGFSSLGLSVACFMLLFCLSAGGYLHKSGYPQTKESIFYLAVLFISSIPFFLFDNSALKFLDLIFVSIVFVYWICVTTQRRIEKKLSAYLLWDLAMQFFFVPFSNFTCQFAGFAQIGKKSKKGKNILTSLLGLLIFLPILIWVIQLLMDADAVFETMIGRLSFSVSRNFTDYVVQVLLGIPVSCYLYGLIYGDATGRYTGEHSIASVKEAVSSFQFAPRAAIFTALSALNAVYLLFFFSQGKYLLSAFGNALPYSMTYAEYARRGFFELCTVAGINLVTIAAAYLIMKRKETTPEDGNEAQDSQKEKKQSDWGLRMETAVLSIFTLLLIITGISKMGMYIHYYGLTLLRVYTTWFMIVLLTFFCIILIRQFIRFEAGKTMALSFIVLFLLLSFGNVDGQIAKYNIARYQQGTLEKLDIASFYRLSAATVPYLSDLYTETEDPKLKRQVQRILINQPWREERKITLQNYNYQMDQAQEKIDALNL